MLGFSNLKQQPVSLSEGKTGFLISPFVNTHLKNSYLIPADWLWSSDQPFSIPNNPDVVQAPFWEKFATLSLPQAVSSPMRLLEDPKAHQTHLDLVVKAIQNIKAQRLQKVVVSRSQPVVFDQEPAPVLAFAKLENTYEDAFVSLVHHPQEGTWLGASPETLISLDAQNVFRTMALAGTQRYQEGKSMAQAVWTQKEIEEQALVSRYIVDCFKKIRVRAYQEEGPKTIKAGNVLHLKTDFWVDTEAINMPSLPDQMLQLLHPTSAVCGTPLQESLSFIIKNEDYHRSLYAGFWGPINMSGMSWLFVNLRCMRFDGNQARLFAGGGITEDSDPLQEWEETQQKCQTLLKVLCI